MYNPKALLLVALVCFIIPKIVSSNETTTDDEDTDDETVLYDDMVDSRDIDEVFYNDQYRRKLFDGAVDRGKLISIFERGIEMLRHPPKKRRSRRQRSDVDEISKRLIRFAMNDDKVGSTSSEKSNSPIKKPKMPDPDYCDDSMMMPSTSSDRRDTSLSTKRRIVDLANRGASEETIRKKYSWYRRQYLDGFKKCVDQGTSRTAIMDIINDAVLKKVRETRDRGHPLRGYMIRDWAMRKSKEIDGADFFHASTKWLHNFKYNNRIVSRKITKIKNRAELNQQEAIDNSIESFLDTYTDRISRFDDNNIWNTDQSGFNYEVSRERTLSFMGERDTVYSGESSNKQTHSYTVQPIISRDGRVIGKLLLCLQEPDGSFGPRVRETVEQLQQEYGNVVILASSSGKMTSRLLDSWISEVLNPSVARTDSWNCPSPNPDDECPNVALLLDSWSGHTNPFFRNRIREFSGARAYMIPKHTTSSLQPLDVGFNRQHKLFVKRITEKALQEGSVRRVTSREGIINMQSLIWNQFSARIYQDMIRYAWHRTDPMFSMDELTRHPPATVRDIQFGFDHTERCEVDGCEEHAFIRCSHCGKLLCLHHFLNRTCFHNIDEHDDAQSLQTLSISDLDPADFDDGDDLDLDLMDRYQATRSPRFNMTTTTTTTENYDFDDEYRKRA